MSQYWMCANILSKIGNIAPALTPDVNVDVFTKTIDINIKGTLLCVRAVSKAMSKQEPLTYTSRRYGTRSLGRGCIVNLGSINSFMAAPGMSPYIASKHAVVGITKSAALDCTKHHIRVNSVCPSFTDTAMMRAGYKRTPGLEQIVNRDTPLCRSAVAEEIADYIVFLCSPSASYINGTGLTIDSGITLTAHL
jgi:NAD(P)-dependent dehydrogenase (short-subunit alcohol dehydrogenase family)